MIAQYPELATVHKRDTAVINKRILGSLLAVIANVVGVSIHLHLK